MNTEIDQHEDPLLSSQILKPVNLSSIRLRLMIAVIMLLLLAQGFNAGLSISAFASLHTESLISVSRSFARNMQRDLSKAISFGKSLEKFPGIDSYFEKIRNADSKITNVIIANPDGKILHSTDKNKVGTILPDPLAVNFSELDSASATGLADSQAASESVLFEQHYHILLPLKDRAKVWKGTIVVSFPAEITHRKSWEIIKQNLQVLAATTMVAALLLFLGLNLFARIKRGEAPPRKRIFLVVLVVVGSAQMVYSLFNIQHFKTNYVSIMQDKVEKSNLELQKEINDLLKLRTIEIDQLKGMAGRMQEIIRANPEVEDLRITTQDGETLYWANAQKVFPGKIDETVRQMPEPAVQAQPMFQVLAPLPIPRPLPLHKGDKQVGFAHVQPSNSTLRLQVGEIIADSLTVLVISLLFVIELVIFLLILIQKQLYRSRDINSRTTSNYGLIRPAAFIYLFAMDLPVSFLALHMKNLEPIFDLPETVATGLPLSVAMLFAGIMINVAGSWMDRRGWQEPFFVGVLLTAVGACLAGFAQTGVEFVAARAIMGIGYGSTYISIQGFVINHVHAPLRARGISDLTAGFFAGSICGTISGGMLAERLGFSAVFFVSAVMATLVILFGAIFMARVFAKPEARNKDDEKPRAQEFLRFIFDRNVISLMIFSSLPAALAMTGILYYISPIYLDGKGIGQAHIGRIVMLYGLCIIFLPRLVSPMVERCENKRPFIFLSGICAGLGMFAFYLFEGVTAVIVTIGMLGIAGSLGLASQPIYALNLRATQRFGQGPAMGIYRSVERLGQVLGPLILGSMLLLLGLKEALAWLGGGILLASFVFFFISKTELEAESR